MRTDVGPQFKSLIGLDAIISIQLLSDKSISPMLVGDSSWVKPQSALTEEHTPVKMTG